MSRDKSWKEWAAPPRAHSGGLVRYTAQRSNTLWLPHSHESPAPSITVVHRGIHQLGGLADGDALDMEQRA